MKCNVSRLVPVSVIAGLLGVTSSAIAVAAWTNAAIPSEVYTGYTGGTIYVNGLSNAAGCGLPIIKFTTTTSDPEKIRSLATASLLSGKKLQCFVDGCVTEGATTYQVGKQCRLLRD